MRGYERRIISECYRQGSFGAVSMVTADSGQPVLNLKREAAQIRPFQPNSTLLTWKVRAPVVTAAVHAGAAETSNRFSEFQMEPASIQSCCDEMLPPLKIPDETDFSRCESDAMLQMLRRQPGAADGCTH